MSVTLETQQVCRQLVELTLVSARMFGRDPVEVLKAYRAAGRCDAPLNDVLMREIDRALLELAEAVPA